MCMPGTVAQIFIDGRTLHIKCFAGKFKQRTNVPVPLQKWRTVFLSKNSGLPYRTAILGVQRVVCKRETFVQRETDRDRFYRRKI